MPRKPQFTDTKNYALGMVVEIIAICVMMLTAFLIGVVLVSWYL